MAQRKVTCPHCSGSFVPPSAPARKRKPVLLSDDDCIVSYAALAARGGVESYVTVYERFGPFVQPAPFVRPLCGYCGKIASATNGGYVCDACSSRWAAVNKRAAEVARLNRAA